MPKRTDIEKILLIGSGPIVIGQACEFDYSGTQGCRALKKEGFKIILINSNPATIMTDPEFAEATYIEPLTFDFVEKVIAKEKPDALLPTLGGQTALNLAIELYEKGVLKKHKVELIGANYDVIKKAEDRELFKKSVKRVGLDVPGSAHVKTLSEAREIAKKIGFPNIIRPSFTLGGGGGSLCFEEKEFDEKVSRGLSMSPINKVLIEESVIGWKEYELEVMRDKADNVVIICPIENIDPMGVHTGDSITVAPAQTLSDTEYQQMRDASIKIIREIGVDTGGSNIQFAVNPNDGRMVVIEMNPRVSRSSALASKATGFPIAKIASLLAVGYNLDEIKNDITKKTPASFEPAIDYVVVKIPRFTFEKFVDTDQTLGVSMKSVGEVMAMGRNFKESLQKALRGLEIGRYGLGADGFGQTKTIERLLKLSDNSIEKKAYLELVKYKLKVPNCDRIFNIKYALQLGLSVAQIAEISKIDKWFIEQIREIVELENQISLEFRGQRTEVRGQRSDKRKNSPLISQLVKKAKRYGFSDEQIGYLSGKNEDEIRNMRKKFGIVPSYKMVDTCAGEFESQTPYFYSTYEEESENTSHKPRATSHKKIMILGGGPNRIGQGIEFDYCCVHAVKALKGFGFETIMVNCNPETVSTDYDVSDKLYFEPLTCEDVLNIVDVERPFGVILNFGGQTPLNLARQLKAAGVNVLGTSPENIDLVEDRIRFGKLLKKLKLPHPQWGSAKTYDEAKKIAANIGYPVIVRPSYVLGGQAMEIVYDEPSLKKYIETSSEISENKPVFMDKFLQDAKECDVDAVCDGKNIFIGGILEHIEEAGIHSGDSASVLPPVSFSPQVMKSLNDYTKILALSAKVLGPVNIQYAIKDEKVYVIEVNPRASRTLPFISKATGIPLVKLAVSCMLGQHINLSAYQPLNLPYFAVKESVLPFNRFLGTDAVLGPEMKSTGEVMGIDKSFALAFAKSQLAAGTMLPKSGNVFLSVQKTDREKILPIARGLSKLGFKLLSTDGTGKYLVKNKIKIKIVKKISEGRPNVVDLIKGSKISLLINTPSGKKTSLSDGYIIRTNATINKIPIITTIPAALAALDAIRALKKNNVNVTPIKNYWPSHNDKIKF